MKRRRTRDELQGRFPGSLRALREKFPTGSVIQARFQLEDGGTVTFEGFLARGGEFERLIEMIHKDGEARARGTKAAFDAFVLARQENGRTPSEPKHETKRPTLVEQNVPEDPPRGAHVDPKRGKVHRKPIRGEPSPQGGGGKPARPAVPKRIILYQAWEESERGWGVRPDGYSLHVDGAHHKEYVEAFWKEQRSHDGGEVPHEYTRESGSPVPVNVSDEVYQQLSAMGGNCRGWRDGVGIDEARNLVVPRGGLPKHG